MRARDHEWPFDRSHVDQHFFLRAIFDEQWPSTVQAHNDAEIARTHPIVYCHTCLYSRPPSFVFSLRIAAIVDHALTTAYNNPSAFHQPAFRVRFASPPSLLQ